MLLLDDIERQMSRISIEKIGLWNNTQPFAFDFTLLFLSYSENLY